MPRYYFCVQYNGEISDPGDGLEFAHDHAAWAHATKFSGETIAEIDGHLAYESEWRLDVQDHRQEPLFTLRFLTESHKS